MAVRLLFIMVHVSQRESEVVKNLGNSLIEKPVLM